MAKLYQKYNASLIENFIKYKESEFDAVNISSKKGLLEVLENYIKDEKSNVSFTSARGYCNTIIAYFSAKYSYYIDVNAKKFLYDRIKKILKKNRADPVYDKESFTVDEVSTIYSFLKKMVATKTLTMEKAWKYDRLFLAFTLGLFSGGRRTSEILKAKVGDFKFDQRYRNSINLMIWDLQQTKNHFYSEAPIVRVDQNEGNMKKIFMDYVNKYGLKDEHYLFYSSHFPPGEIVECVKGFSNRIRNFFVEMGFDKRFSTRTLRKTFITVGRQAGFTDAQIAINTLHKSVASLEHYDRRYPVNLTNKTWGHLISEPQNKIIPLRVCSHSL